ncbi:ABC transporter ATP-binding protein [Paralimibaculum aggregatum]|uniref:ABC transporter ATP-binding protein n=1 Tax=Paralimibaculum aggregatum TaxID=3036245 RepID=UPI002554B9A5|nr:ABC transporter ATP-binding protein [Limibaculum sp. NKW23]
MDAPFVEAAGLTRQWNGAGGVADVSLAIPRGGFVSILGPSGCGKSTLLRLLAGLETPQAGSIRIDGRDMTHAPAAARGLSMVFQSYALFPHLSVAENILFGMRVRRAPRAERAARLAEAVAMLGLEGLERRRPAELSGGQRQRVALARAVVSGHPLCLMDEPLSNLDAKLRHSVRRDIKALQRRLGLTVVYVTHDQTEAMSLSDIVVLMRAGRVEQIAPPAALYAAPVSIFAAEFVGEPPMAMVQGAALGMPGRVVGIRPEKLRLAAPGAGDLTGRVVDVEFLGAGSRVVIEHAAARGLVASVAGAAGLAPGTEIGLCLPEDDRVLFDALTGRAERGPQQDRGAQDRQTGPRDGRKAPSPQPPEPQQSNL